MKNEIGSNFWITSRQYQSIVHSSSDDEPQLWGSNITFLSTCRSAISSALSSIEGDSPKVALLPAFTCHSVLHPFLEMGYKVFPYRVNTDLSIDPEAFIADVRIYHPSVVLVHSYFGFNTTGNLQSIVDQLKAKGVFIIEDLTQRLFSTFESQPSNCQVGSIRKWMPIPDGAFISTVLSDTIDEDKELVQAKMEAMMAKGDYIVEDKGEKSAFRQLLKDAEDLLDSRTRSYRMSKASRLIFNSYDLHELAKRRSDNYRYLVRGMRDFEDLEILFPDLDDATVPFLLPVLVKKNRKALQQYLASKEIFPTVIWACPQHFRNLIDKQAQYVYDSILCFHCDQRYNVEDMQRIYIEINNYYNKIG